MALALALAGLSCAGLAWWLVPPGPDARVRILVALLVLAPVVAAIWLALHASRALDRARATLSLWAGQEETREQALQVARMDKELLIAALHQLPIGIAIFDRSDRTVLHNRFLAQLIPGLKDAPDASGHLQLLRLERALGVVPHLARDSQPDHDASAPANPQMQSVLLEYPQDHWIQGLASRSGQGVTVVARADVTELVRARHQATEANEQLSRQSATDDLTGITNRRRFDEILRTEWQRAARSEGCLSLLMVDIDHFKRFNDHYGHVAGDECLRQVARLLHRSVRRAGEVVARYGGEEFVILLPAAEVEQAEELAQLCLDGIAGLTLPHASSPTADHVTFSIGIAHVFPSASHEPESLVNAADTAMYRSKVAGRARYEVADLADWEIDKDAPRSRAGDLS